MERRSLEVRCVKLRAGRACASIIVRPQSLEARPRVVLFLRRNCVETEEFAAAPARLWLYIEELIHSAVAIR